MEKEKTKITRKKGLIVKLLELTQVKKINTKKSTTKKYYPQYKTYNQE